MQCAYHPDREPMGACVACGKLICMECKAVLGGKIYCTPCADKLFIKENAGQSARETAAPAAIDSQTKPETKPPSKMYSTQPSDNTSGQGSTAVVPDEIKGWSWGAFFLSWIWGIGNRVWIAFIVFVLGIIWAIVLGIKGNEWAWKNKKWDSVEHFKKTQRTWKRWGIALFIIAIIISIISIIISVISAGLAFDISI